VFHAREGLAKTYSAIAVFTHNGKMADIAKFGSKASKHDRRRSPSMVHFT